MSQGRPTLRPRTTPVLHHKNNRTCVYKRADIREGSNLDVDIDPGEHVAREKLQAGQMLERRL